MRILFVAPVGAAFGEALQGIRLATRLSKRGHDIVFLASAALRPVIEPTPFLFGRIDRSMHHLDRALTSTLARLGCDAMVLVDVAAVGQVVRTLSLDIDAFLEPAVPVFGLDCWNLSESPVPWEYVPTSVNIDARFHAFARTIRPVPFAPLDVARGFAALPTVAHASDAQRARVRTQLGLRGDDRLIVLPTARWQHAGSHDTIALAQRAALLPELVLPVFDRLGDRTHIVHIGPIPFEAAERLASRYHFIGQIEPKRFESLLAAADLLASFNAAATSLSTAVAAGVPVVLGTTNCRAKTWEDVALALSDWQHPTLRAAVEAALPLTPLRAWPLALKRVLDRSMVGNPFYDTMSQVDPFNPRQMFERCRQLLDSSSASDDVRHRQAKYRERVYALPAGDDVLMSML